MAVAGPMARTAEDLNAGLNVLAGPERPESIAMGWTLPAARHQSLREFRVGFVLEDPEVPLGGGTKISTGASNPGL